MKLGSLPSSPRYLKSLSVLETEKRFLEAILSAARKDQGI